MVRLFSIALAFILLFCTFNGVSAVTKHKIENIKQVSKSNHSGPTLSERERHLSCLAKNIYYEAGSESFEGKVAVAQVTLNRAASGKFPSDICKVVYQKTLVSSKFVCQFSWYCENGPAIKSNERYVESMEVAKKVLLENFRLSSLKSALYFHADYIKTPNWGKPVVARIGRHIFYADRG